MGNVSKASIPSSTFKKNPFRKVWTANSMFIRFICFNPLSANPTNWSDTLKQFSGKLPTNCLSVFDHFVGLALKGLFKKQFLCHSIRPVSIKLISWLSWRVSHYCFVCSFPYSRYVSRIIFFCFCVGLTLLILTRSNVFIVNFQHIPHLFMFLWLILNR